MHARQAALSTGGIAMKRCRRGCRISAAISFTRSRVMPFVVPLRGICSAVPQPEDGLLFQFAMLGVQDWQKTEEISRSGDRSGVPSGAPPLLHGVIPVVPGLVTGLHHRLGLPCSLRERSGSSHQRTRSKLHLAALRVSATLAAQRPGCIRNEYPALKGRDNRPCLRVHPRRAQQSVATEPVSPVCSSFPRLAAENSLLQIQMRDGISPPKCPLAIFPPALPEGVRNPSRG